MSQPHADPPLRYRDNTACQKRKRGIEATVNGGKFRQDKVQHGENDQGGPLSEIMVG
ncbi:Uncharacterised protein [Salmonella enterica]|uniref:Uncharacterized protein n=1 Tax=Salmonella sp. NCTC 6947 TaxID=2583581 RepID=A0A509CJU2_9ENTR|nr:Uncharacterised protein [Salmonella enterica]